MDPRELHANLRLQIGRLTPAGDAPAGELERFHRTIAQHYAVSPNLRVIGNRLAHEGATPVISEAEPAFIERIADALAGPSPAAETVAAPLLFRRETAFRSDLLGNSVPAWGTGMAPVATFGPFLDDHGLKIWFDLYQPIRLVSFYLAGVAAPVLRAPVRGLLLNGRQSYRIEAGSVWIASDLIARVPALQGYYTGLTVRGGSLDLSVAATMSGTDVLIAAAADAVLHLDLDQPAPARIAQDAGGDAIASSVQLPATFDLRFQIHASSLKAGAAAATAFGCTVRFVPSAQPPIWAALVSQILVPYQATTNTQTPDRFEVATSTSALCTVNGSAQIDSSGTGWLLPAAKLDPLTVGAAAGIGAMSIALTRGISATWKNLKGGRTALPHPAIIVDPATVSVIDFTASNVNGRQRWRLWRNLATRHASEIILTFGQSFAFIFISSIANSEGVLCFCTQEAKLDRPVDANGKPFAIKSTNALASTLQTGKTFSAGLIDSDLLFDGNFNNADAYRQYSIALRNALFTVGARCVLRELLKAHRSIRNRWGTADNDSASRACTSMRAPGPENQYTFRVATPTRVIVPCP